MCAVEWALSVLLESSDVRSTGGVEMYRSKKDNVWYFRASTHAGADDIYKSMSGPRKVSSCEVRHPASFALRSTVAVGGG